MSPNTIRQRFTGGLLEHGDGFSHLIPYVNHSARQLRHPPLLSWMAWTLGVSTQEKTPRLFAVTWRNDQRWLPIIPLGCNDLTPALENRLEAVVKADPFRFRYVAESWVLSNPRLITSFRLTETRLLYTEQVARQLGIHKQLDPKNGIYHRPQWLLPGHLRMI
jgi:hypothetical protein